MAPFLEGVVESASTLVGRELALVRPLTGGQHATTLLVRDASSRYVVRAFPAADGAAAREATILERLRPLGALVPRLVAHGEGSGRPVIVTSAIPGGPPAPTTSLRAIAERMAAALVRVHQLDGTGLRVAPARPPPGDAPVAVRARDEWDRLDTSERVLTHYDFWCGNALWAGDDLTGVVDWSGARDAPRGVDVAWCRLDLVLLGSTAAADHFLAQYERGSGRTVTGIGAWDVQAAAQADPAVESWAPNYEGIGRNRLTGDVLRRRLDAWVATL